MTVLLAMLMPVSIFLLQAWIAVVLDFEQVQKLYFGFLGAYIPAFFFFLNATRRQRRPHVWNERFDPYIKAFLFIKIVVVFYFGLIFVYYFSSNGYANVRQYMTSKEIQDSPFYFAPLMYLDAYIIYPLNYLVLLSLFIQKRWGYFKLLLLLIFLQTVVFYASRIIFYNVLILAFFAGLHLRLPLRKIAFTFALLAFTGLVFSLVIAFNRDASIGFEGVQSIRNSLIIGVANYHLIPPLILDSIIETSSVFGFGSGYGLASFGFLLDPVISLLPITDSKSLMASKMLSAEAQNFIFVDGDLTYNAYTTFLYAAAYDFGLIGPILYGALFGAGIGYGFGRRDGVGFIIFCIFAYFVFFNAFTFFITGDWFWALVFAAVCFKPARNRTSHPEVTRVTPRFGLDQQSKPPSEPKGHSINGV